MAEHLCHAGPLGGQGNGGQGVGNGGQSTFPSGSARPSPLSRPSMCWWRAAPTCRSWG